MKHYMAKNKGNWEIYLLIIAIIIIISFPFLRSIEKKRNWEIEGNWQCGYWEKYESNFKFDCYGKVMDNCEESDSEAEKKLNTIIQKCECKLNNTHFNIAEKICTKRVDIYKLKTRGGVIHEEIGINNDTGYDSYS